MNGIFTHKAYRPVSGAVLQTLRQYICNFYEDLFVETKNRCHTEFGTPDGRVQVCKRSDGGLIFHVFVNERKPHAEWAAGELAYGVLEAAEEFFTPYALALQLPNNKEVRDLVRVRIEANLGGQTKQFCPGAIPLHHVNSRQIRHSLEMIKDLEQEVVDELSLGYKGPGIARIAYKTEVQYAWHNNHGIIHSDEKEVPKGLEGKVWNQDSVEVRGQPE